MSCIHVTVTVDRDTVYRTSTAEAGGENSPWRFVHHFRPPPPPTATELHLTFQSEDGSTQAITVATTT